LLLAQKATAGGHRVTRLRRPLLLQLANLLLRLLDRHVLYENCLCHEIKRVRPRADVLADEILRFWIARRRWSLGNLTSKVG